MARRGRAERAGAGVMSLRRLVHVGKLFQDSRSVPVRSVLACFRSYWPDLIFTVTGFENRIGLPTVAT
jgi:hypothetical protein